MAIANITNNILTDSGVATSALQIALNGTGFVKIVGTTISYDNSTYLTTSAAASTYQTILTNPVTGTGTTNYLPKFTGTSSIANSIIYDNSGNVLINTTDASIGHRLAVYSATEAAQLRVMGLAPSVLFTESTTNTNTYSAYLGVVTSTNNFYTGSFVGDFVMSNNSDYGIAFAVNNSQKLRIANTGAATFASSVTATSFVKTGGTSAQFLKADGSVDSSTYLTTSSAASTYLPLAGGTLTGALGGTSATFSDIMDITANNSTAINLVLRGRALDSVGQMEFWNNAKSTRYGYISTDSTSMSMVSTQAIPLVLGTNLTTRLTIASTGAATFSSSVSLTDELIFSGAAVNTSIKTFGSGDRDRLRIRAYNEVNLNSDTLLTFNTGGSERMRITSGGALCLGVTSAYGTNLLNVNGGIYATSSVAAVVAADLDMMVFQNTGATYSKACLVASMTATGGTGSYFFYGQQSTSTVALKIFSNGNIQNTNNSYGAISDARLKENIKDATPKLDDLMKVKVRNYNLKGESNKQLGVISQELEAIFPNMIEESTNMGENMKIKGVKYSVFVPMLIKAVQELKAEIEILKNK
jgi:hypothetical protein